MQATSDACQEELARCAVDLILSEPFFGHLLGGVVRVVDEQTSTAGVCYTAGRYHLHVNPTWFQRQLRSRRERVAILKHEALHLLLGHVLRYDPHRHDRFRFGIAADLVVNQLIGPRWLLPVDALVLSAFPGLSADRSLDEYYAQLALEDLGELLVAEWHSDHGQWGVEDPTDRALAELELARLAGDAMRRAGGKIPGDLKGTVMRLIEGRAPRLDWRRQLRIFAATSAQTRVSDTLRRPSRRYGTFPGLRLRRQQRLVVGVDTSGSIRPEELNHFYAEIQGIHRTGAEILVVEFDAEVQAVYPWSGRIPARARGQGGTRYDPFFRWLAERRRPPDGCLLLTDGHAPAPTRRPPCPLLWLLTHEGTEENLCYGRVLRIHPS